MKLVSSEYEHPSARATVWGAREQFLDMVSEFVPKAITDLHGKPFDCFLQTGIAELDLSQKIAFTKEPSRSIYRFWLSFENGSQSCVYFTPSECRMKFLHETCEEQTKLKLKKLVSEGVLDNPIYFMFETTFLHFLTCPSMVALWKALKDWSAKNNLTPKGSKNWCLESAFHTRNAAPKRSTTINQNWSFKKLGKVTNRNHLARIIHEQMLVR